MNTLFLLNCIKCISQNFLYKNIVRKVVIPASVKKIEEGAFEECENLTNIILHDGIEKIKNNWFTRIPVKQIIIPKSVKMIGNGAFSECMNLVSIILQEGLEIIGDECFSNGILNDIDNQIREITIPKTVKSIGNKAFYNCGNLTSITL